MSKYGVFKVSAAVQLLVIPMSESEDMGSSVTPGTWMLKSRLSVQWCTIADVIHQIKLFFLMIDTKYSTLQWRHYPKSPAWYIPLNWYPTKTDYIIGLLYVWACCTGFEGGCVFYITTAAVPQIISICRVMVCDRSSLWKVIQLPGELLLQCDLALNFLCLFSFFHTKKINLRS